MRRHKRTRAKGLRRLFSRAGGQSLVELALILPLLLIMVFGIIDFGQGLRSYIGVTNATREGARAATVGTAAGTYPANCTGTSSTTVIGRVCTTVGLGVSSFQNVSVTYPNGTGPGKSVVVAANYRYTFITPIGDIIGFFSGGVFPNYIDLTSSSNMRQE